MNCPHCQGGLVELMDVSRQTLLLDYYTCRDCGHVWITHKASQIVVKHMTQGRSTPPKPSHS